MSWRVLRWTWQLGWPLFVGTSPAGSLNRCRLYVPARALWGALTAELSRVEGDDDQKYRTIGDALRQHARFSYLYPAEQVDGRWWAWLPAYRDELGLVWQREDDTNAAGVITDRAFRCRILHTRPSTAIDPGSDTAADGSLRETECLQPRWRDAGGRDAGPVALVGYVLVRQSSADVDGVIERLLRIPTIFVGGDTRYGLGRLDRLCCDAAAPADRIFGQVLELGGEEPVVRSRTVLAHAYAGATMSGAFEALSGWDVGRQTALGSDGAPLWAPGSVARNGAASFEIDGHGTWHPRKTS